MLANDFFAALLIGLLGAGHCLGMCSGIASAITFSVNTEPSKFSSRLSLLLYNLGRISSYSVAGAIFAASSSVLVLFFGGKEALIYLRLLAAILMLLLALYISRIWFGLLKLEQAGQVIWKFIKPIAQLFIPLKHPLYAFPLGFLWGWLPCGLVYSTLSWAASSGSAFNGFIIMVGFGLGTLPAMLSVGALSQQLKYYLNHHYFRYGSGILLAIFAIHTFYIAARQLS
ncbi:sulfite exporter TauE/SafE family protein [Psychromonas antarctica]|uniref:sulfite exporter TauE/SafE family protein n=1 Tax=Psychromonas antarctica TaxID=67573 RepID=UPI001EE9952C|nr:sulfite exporter TauE/SafE family protein [Psychromonas antarctica]MCG6201351.1 sulfite exporter TauE/SafE family protein [Psychromonas antarctica]